MKWVETIEIYRENAKQVSFEYEIKSKIEQGYTLIRQTEDYARLAKQTKNHTSIEEFKRNNML
jgi:hypothetical protein